MIIVSQNKDIIVNFDKTQNIWIDDNVLDKTNTSFEVYADEINLGEYKTEERAKEVLKEMTEKYEDIELAKYDRRSFATRDNFIYRIPKE